MRIVRAIVAGERDAHELAKLRDRRCGKSEEEIVEQLSGHWREDHLFSLRQALKMYDAIQERIADYEREILRKLVEMERAECHGQEPPKLKNPQKAKAIQSELPAINRLIVAEKGVQSKGVILFPVEIFTWR